MTGAADSSCTILQRVTAFDSPRVSDTDAKKDGILRDAVLFQTVKEQLFF